VTTVTVFFRPAGDLAGLRAEGHAAYARRRQDIVCSAVSALTQTAVNALEAVAGVPTEPVVNEKTGLLEVILPGGLTAKQAADCQIVLRTVVQGLTDIAESYPGQVRVVYKEWREQHA
jgi:uncharacterized protein YsxB (DUF464 family)